MEAGKKVAAVKATGTKKYPVSLFDRRGTGLRIGCCGISSVGDTWSLDKCVNGKPYVYKGAADRDCPGTAAMGAARLLLW